ncbi:MAG: methionyl-tRNA formyltransferase [Chthoniobacter sp.]|jgi:methionyl-tRNA formyltransferase|nr:methionyl-tRNA formyltransferase [Chthoniobacter sp.]
MMRIVFMGTGEIGVPAFRWLLDWPGGEVVAAVTQPDKPVGRRQELHASAIKQLALVSGVPILQPQRMRAPESVAEIAALQPDTIVVMAYGQILPRAVLEAPRLACLNLHASILPRHRGAAPIHAAIEAGDRTTGITVMYMAEGLDTGDILLIRETPIRRRDTCGSLHDRLGLLAAEALAEALPLIAQGRAPRIAQNEAEATYAAKLTREQGEIDWTAPQTAIDRRIRAMNPWPAAHTWLPTTDGLRKLKLFSCIQHRHDNGGPGVVLRADKRGLLVGAGGGAVLLRDLQLEGKRRMPARDFLLGHPVPAGTLLGRAAGSSSSSSSFS